MKDYDKEYRKLVNQSIVRITVVMLLALATTIANIYLICSSATK